MLAPIINAGRGLATTTKKPMTFWAIITNWVFRFLILVGIYLGGVSMGTSGSYVEALERLSALPGGKYISENLKKMDANADLSSAVSTAAIAKRMNVLSKGNDALISRLDELTARQGGVETILLDINGVSFETIEMASSYVITTFEGKCQ